MFKLGCGRIIGLSAYSHFENSPAREIGLRHIVGMPYRKTRDHNSAFPDREIIAKAEGRFAKADKQRTGLNADPEREVAREKQRITHRKGKDKRKK